jgi:chemotaxis protein methyltransferase CheR
VKEPVDAIFCRNVMIYFDTPLQDRVHRLFSESLQRLGVLALGPKESIAFTPHVDDYEVLDLHEKLYRKVR